MINVPWPRGARRDATTRHRRLLVQSHHCLLRPREAAATAWLSPPRILITSERTRGRTWQKRARWISRRLMRRFISLTFQSIIVHPWDRAAALCSLVPLSASKFRPRFALFFVSFLLSLFFFFAGGWLPKMAVVRLQVNFTQIGRCIVDEVGSEKAGIFGHRAKVQIFEKRCLSLI